MTVDILLATYNGARFLPAQLDSIAAQDHAGWRIIARDDGSTDDTAYIVQDFAEKHPGKVFMFPEGPKQGAAGNFAALMRASDAPYAMFCDQDDVWYPDKISKTLEAMKALELMYGSDTPLLVHTDARVVDSYLSPLRPSYSSMMKLHPKRHPLSRLLVQNTVHGCTAMLNRPLILAACNMPESARMHDHWAALVAASLGMIAYLNFPTLDYRQHDANVIGARARSVRNLHFTVQRNLRENIRQAEGLLDAIGFEMKDGTKALVEEFIEMPHLPPLTRRKRLLLGGYLRWPLYQNLPVLALV